MDLIGEVGGFNDALFLIFEFVMSYYTPTLFIQSLVKSMFQIDLFQLLKNNKARIGDYKQM
jgi:hypothetical protein